MTVRELIDWGEFVVVNEGTETSMVITKPFCCDLLSIAMSKASAGVCWVTVMGNMNTLAVATLCEAACIILAEGIVLDEQALAKAREKGVTVLRTELSVFDAAFKVQCLLDGKA